MASETVIYPKQTLIFRINKGGFTTPACGFESILSISVNLGGWPPPLTSYSRIFESGSPTKKLQRFQFSRSLVDCHLLTSGSWLGLIIPISLDRRAPSLCHTNFMAGISYQFCFWLSFPLLDPMLWLHNAYVSYVNMWYFCFPIDILYVYMRVIVHANQWFVIDLHHSVG